MGLGGSRPSKSDPAYEQRVIDAVERALTMCNAAFAPPPRLRILFDTLLTPRLWHDDGDDAAGGGDGKTDAGRDPNGGAAADDAGTRCVARIRDAVPAFHPLATLEIMAHGGGHMRNHSNMTAAHERAACRCLMEDALRFMYYARDVDRRCDYDPLNAPLPVLASGSGGALPHSSSALVQANAGDATVDAPYRDTLLSWLSGSKQIGFVHALLDLTPNPPCWNRVRCDPMAGDIASPLNAHIINNTYGLDVALCERLIDGMSVACLVRTHALHCVVSRATHTMSHDNSDERAQYGAVVRLLLDKCVADDGSGSCLCVPPVPPPSPAARKKSLTVSTKLKAPLLPVGATTVAAGAAAGAGAGSGTGTCWSDAADAAAAAGTSSTAVAAANASRAADVKMATAAAAAAAAAAGALRFETGGEDDTRDDDGHKSRGGDGGNCSPKRIPLTYLDARHQHHMSVRDMCAEYLAQWTRVGSDSLMPCAARIVVKPSPHAVAMLRVARALCDDIDRAYERVLAYARAFPDALRRSSFGESMGGGAHAEPFALVTTLVLEGDAVRAPAPPLLSAGAGVSVTLKGDLALPLSTSLFSSS